MNGVGLGSGLSDGPPQNSEDDHSELISIVAKSGNAGTAIAGILSSGQTHDEMAPVRS
jgi:hypothetical protein